ncbi:MAG: TonB-dependent hemoglobin/transferrin/lactoferrin family receptor [Acidobacteriota bacterium]
MRHSVFHSSTTAGSLGRLAAILFLLMAPLSLANPLVASDLPGDDEDANVEPAQTFLEEVTVTATRSERALADTPGQVDVVGQQEIEERGYTGLDDLVRYVPGVDVEGDPTRLGTSGFTIRGIGGNRVLTTIDGVPSAEQFDFGPFSIFQFALDIDTLESVEIVRSAGSALYGSDALGGVVSLTTRSPRSYLGAERSYLGLRGGFDGRNDEASLSATGALGGDKVQASLLYTRRDGSEADNQGTIDTQDFTRTAPNPIDRQQDNALLQVSFTPSDSSSWLGAVEFFETEAETEVFSSINPGSPFASAVRDADGLDTQERTRVSLEYTGTSTLALADSVLFRVFNQATDTEQVTTEIREPSQGLAFRDGLLTFEQDTFGARGELRKALGSSTLLTYGVSWLQDEFDQLRDRTETIIATGAPVPTSLAFPTKYFPQSDVEELGAFVQAEIELFDGKLSLVPGVRFDSYDLDADQQDAIFLAGNPGTPEPVDFSEDKVSPKLGAVLSLTDTVSVFAQYARGFRAPPMSDVNNGFTNQGGGYRTLPNPDLQPETSDNVELGLRVVTRRASFSIAGFDNQYEDFIDTVFLGFNPAVFLIEFQPQNVSEVSIRGVEIGGEARFGRGFKFRGAFTYTEGDNDITDEPLASIAPPQLVLGLQYAAEGGRWGAELIGTANDSRSASDLPSDSTLFQIPSSEVFDLVAWLNFTEQLSLQVSAWNLTDETFWRWAYGRGLTEGSATLDRFTDPGRSVGAQLRYTF